jgi:ABC-2 type transport system permease protein
MSQADTVAQAGSFRAAIEAEAPRERLRQFVRWAAATLAVLLVGLVASLVRRDWFAPWGFLVCAVGLGGFVVGVTAYFKPNIGVVFGREVRALFFSPVAYLVLLGMVAVTGLNYWNLAVELARARFEFAGQQGPMVAYVALSLWFWIAFVILLPIVTMRFFSEEQRSGTIEVLLTAPVTEAEVVLGKYFACLAFYPLLWAPSAFFLVVLYRQAQFDYWPILACYLGVLTLGAMVVAIGLFFSSMTRNQVVAAIMTAATLVLLFAFAWLHQSARSSSSAWAEPLKYTAILFQLMELAQGRMDVRYLVLHASVAAFMLYLTVKVLEARKGH